MSCIINFISVTPLLDTIGMTPAPNSLIIHLPHPKTLLLFEILIFRFSYRRNEDRNRRFRSRLQTLWCKYSSFKRKFIKFLISISRKTWFLWFSCLFLVLFWSNIQVFNGFKINVTIYFTSQRFNADLDGSDGEFSALAESCFVLIRIIKISPMSQRICYRRNVVLKIWSSHEEQISLHQPHRDCSTASVCLESSRSVCLKIF